MNIDRGVMGRTPRLRSLNLESQQDFIRGFRRWVYGPLDKAAQRRSADLLDRSGLDKGPDSPLEAVADALHGDPLVATRNRCWCSSQTLMRRDLLSHLKDESDYYLGLMDAPPAGEGANEGGLELDPDFDIPAYARHEIHLQPGGYVGEDFAGFLYHHGTNSFYTTFGGNESDQIHEGLARRAAEPANGAVQRVVDLGCGIGQLSMGLKARYPTAEVIGVDLAAPMLRYGRQRTAAYGHPVRFVQALAEDTGLDAGSADMVCAYLLFHEIPTAIAQKVVAEAYRLLRPGCVFNVFDFQTGETRGAYDRYASWVDHRYNSEVWSQEYLASDFRGMLTAAGFVLDADDGVRGMTLYAARKPLTS
jgi:ubiquinone/menaquinone biosynthesis C-methylase UbiE